MKVKELIKKLKDYNQNYEVQAKIEGYDGIEVLGYIKGVYESYDEAVVLTDEEVE